MPFIQSINPLWNHILASCPYDIYHLPEYVQLLAEHALSEAIAWHFDLDGKSVILPLVKRRINYNIDVEGLDKDILYDLQSPYGYPGVLSNVCLNDREADCLLENYQHEASEAGFVSSFIRLNPILNKWDITESDLVNRYHPGNLIILPLDSENKLVFSDNHYRNISRLKKTGFSILVNEMKLFPDFIKSYTCQMLDQMTDEFYLFEPEYFYNFLRLPGGKIFFISIVSPENEFASGGIFSLYGKIMQFQYGTTEEKFKHLSPSKLMIEAAIEMGKNFGATFLNLGGGYKTNCDSGLYKFKKGFNIYGKPSKYSCLKIIHQPLAYNALPKISNNYFPAYRTN